MSNLDLNYLTALVSDLILKVKFYNFVTFQQIIFSQRCDDLNFKFTRNKIKKKNRKMNSKVKSFKIFISLNYFKLNQN